MGIGPYGDVGCRDGPLHRRRAAVPLPCEQGRFFRGGCVIGGRADVGIGPYGGVGRRDGPLHRRRAAVPLPCKQGRFFRGGCVIRGRADVGIAPYGGSLGGSGGLLGEGQGPQAGLQRRDAGVAHSDAELLRRDLPAAQPIGLRVGDGEGGEVILPGTVAEVVIAQRLALRVGQRQRLRREAEQTGGLGTGEIELRAGEAALSQQGQSPGDSGSGTSDQVRFIEDEEDPVVLLLRQRVQQRDLGRGIHAAGVQDAEPQGSGEPQVCRQSGQQGPASGAGNANGQFVQSLRGGGCVEHRDNLLIGIYLFYCFCLRVEI